MPTSASTPPDQADPPYTAWHYLLIQSLEALTQPAWLTILPFAKLGTLPLEADALLLLRETSSQQLATLVPEFDFLMSRLARLNVVEYKGPDTTLTWQHCDTAMAYVFMAKRKHGGPELAQVALHFLYSQRSRGLLDVWRRNGFEFVEQEPGVLCSSAWSLKIYLMNLTELSDRRPDDLINLLSVRHRRFVHREHPDPQRRAILLDLYYNVFKETMKMLLQDSARDLPGRAELLENLSELRRRFAQELTLEERLAGLAPAERMADLTPAERMAGLAPEDLRQGLTPQAQERLRALLNRNG